MFFSAANFDNDDDITEFVRCKIESLVANNGNVHTVSEDDAPQGNVCCSCKSLMRAPWNRIITNTDRRSYDVKY